MNDATIISHRILARNLTFWKDQWNGNRAPIANAGPDQVIDTDPSGFASVVLDGRGSNDADGDPLVYRWLLDGQLLASEVHTVATLPSFHTFTHV